MGSQELFSNFSTEPLDSSLFLCRLLELLVPGDANQQVVESFI